MAKAVFHKGQHVYVKPVGTWASIEHVNPQWVKGVEEPLRVTYDVGLGRDFQAHELTGEDNVDTAPDLIETENWRILRAANRLSSSAHAARHPHPGTYPVVVTDDQDWGGWRVPGAEYDRNPERIEVQARIIANAHRLMRVARGLVEFATHHPEDTPTELAQLADAADTVLSNIHCDPTNRPDPSIAAE